jgi:hypothetical protein
VIFIGIPIRPGSAGMVTPTGYQDSVQAGVEGIRSRLARETLGYHRDVGEVRHCVSVGAECFGAPHARFDHERSELADPGRDRWTIK